MRALLRVEYGLSAQPTISVPTRLSSSAREQSTITSAPYNPHPTGQPYTQDGSIVYSPGVGVDYDLAYHWAVRGDYQFEFWNLGYNQTLSPKALTIGVVYRILLHSSGR
jgi:hypothetical protein